MTLTCLDLARSSFRKKHSIGSKMNFALEMGKNKRGIGFVMLKQKLVLILEESATLTLLTPRPVLRSKPHHLQGGTGMRSMHQVKLFRLLPTLRPFKELIFTMTSSMNKSRSGVKNLTAGADLPASAMNPYRTLVQSRMRRRETCSRIPTKRVSWIRRHWQEKSRRAKPLKS